MESQPNINEHLSIDPVHGKADPLIAALPPNTDYITYLTLLEYQLTPERLPTLNRLLQEDDGSLAAGIGWDLLKLVLPMLRVNPDTAQECLDIIARRGNPREVIVRVSEELERLGQDEHDEHDNDDRDADEYGDQEPLPEFPGEAAPVHLGDMRLDGLPDQKKSVIGTMEDDAGHVPDLSEQDLTLQALLSMLSILHPRIKTKYPSRFLATTLPAALGAYRRLSMNSNSTLAFVQMLTKLGGKKRPALPPRASTTDVLVSRLASPNAETSVVSAPLPDPESAKESIHHEHGTVESEAAINQRLLQAVLLEIVDERTTASGEEHPPLTARLRARFNPSSMTSARRAELEGMTNGEAAHIADKVLARFVTAAKDLKLDPIIGLVELKDPAGLEDDGEEVGDYPTKPSHIPLSATGQLLLYSILRYVEAMSGTKLSITDEQATRAVHVVNRQYREDTRMRNSAPAIDLVLALLQSLFCKSHTDSEPRSSSTEPVGDHSLLLETSATLRDIFVTCPDPDLRDNAFYIATAIFHNHCTKDSKLKLLQDMLDTPTQAEISPVQDAQSGNLKSIAVDWLKDELFPHLSNPSNDRLTYAAIEQLSPLIFTANDIPATPAVATKTTDVTEQFAILLPFYISSLNLLSLLARVESSIYAATQSDPSLSDQASAQVTSQLANDNLDLILAKGEAMLSVVEKWKDYLTEQLANESSKADSDGAGLEVAGVPIRDVFALEDVIGRVREVIPIDED